MSPAALRLAECIAHAIALLQPRPVSDASVHAARKAIKKARAALRLLRPALGEAAFRTDNAALRDAGRALAPLRNHASLLGALQALARRHPDRMGGGAARLERELRARRERARRRLAGGRGLDECLRLLERSQRRAMRHAAAARGRAPLRRGLRRIYRTGRRRLGEARQSPSPGTLHEWRKHVKYLANAVAVLGEEAGKAARMASRADALAECLGEHHDLSELARLAPAGAELRELIDGRRSRLAKRALKAGRALYRDKPARFAARMR